MVRRFTTGFWKSVTSTISLSWLRINIILLAALSAPFEHAIIIVSLLKVHDMLRKRSAPSELPVIPVYILSFFKSNIRIGLPLPLFSASWVKYRISWFFGSNSNHAGKSILPQSLKGPSFIISPLPFSSTYPHKVDTTFCGTYLYFDDTITSCSPTFTSIVPS